MGGSRDKFEDREFARTMQRELIASDHAEHKKWRNNLGPWLAGFQPYYFREIWVKSGTLLDAQYNKWQAEILPLTFGRARIVITEGANVEEFW